MEKWQRSLYQPNLPLGADGTKVTASKAHITLSKEAAKEGMVLLKNNESLLPFQAGTKLALFGKGRAHFSGRRLLPDEGRAHDGRTGAAVVPEGGSRYECRRHGRYGLVCRK